MRISHIRIENFRNFHNLDVSVGTSAVILGENQVGKTNLLHALRLVLDPSLPDSARQLRVEDFWDGIARPLTADARIRISIDMADFEENEGQLAILAEHIVQPEPMIARLTFEFGALPGLNHPPTKDEDFEFSVYGGNRPENRVGYDVRKRMPMEVLHALRDVEGDLGRWTKSPLKPLLDRVKSDIKRSDLLALAEGVGRETNKIAKLNAISKLSSLINGKLVGMAGPSQAIETSLGFSPTDPDKLLRALRLLFDSEKREIEEASLGTANVLYLALRSIELDALVVEGSREHTFFSIEEPEAHLHPHLQRLVYRNYLRPREPTNAEGNLQSGPVTFLLTTHSPHIASVTPLDSLIVLRKSQSEDATIGVSGLSLSLAKEEQKDIERYLDVSRAEGLFSRGVLLVEGDAEKFVVPLLSAREGHDLDELGITICSVGGTNFAPYVKFFGPQGLNLPCAVLTDLDPYTEDDGRPNDHGRRRAHALCALMNRGATVPREPQQAGFYEGFGIFLNRSTLEIELNDSGCIHMMNAVMQEVCEVQAAKKRFQQLDDVTRAAECVVEIGDQDRFIRDIEYVGKGRFAQRLCAKIGALNAKYSVCPPYILKAIKHVIQ